VRTGSQGPDLEQITYENFLLKKEINAAHVDMDKLKVTCQNLQ
jgi:hypothetical protein